MKFHEDDVLSPTKGGWMMIDVLFVLGGRGMSQVRVDVRCAVAWLIPVVRGCSSDCLLWNFDHGICALEKEIRSDIVGSFIAVLANLKSAFCRNMEGNCGPHQSCLFKLTCPTLNGLQASRTMPNSQRSSGFKDFAQHSTVFKTIGLPSQYPDEYAQFMLADYNFSMQYKSLVMGIGHSSGVAISTVSGAGFKQFEHVVDLNWWMLPVPATTLTKAQVQSRNNFAKGVLAKVS